MRGADLGTDHNLVEVRVTLRLSRHKAMNTNKGLAYNTTPLKQKDIQSQFELELKQRLESLEEETQYTVEEENIQKTWDDSMIAKIPKKVDLTKCDNSRGISLLSIPGKVFCRVIIDRIRDGVAGKA